MYDIIIVGAGTAGLTAAIYGVRAGKSVLVLEKLSYGGQIINTPDIENYPGFKHISGFEFATSLYEQAKELGAIIKYETVNLCKDEGEYKVIQTNKEEYKCKAVIIATGAKNRPLGIDKEQEFIGKGVSYCATCDGAFFRGKDVCVNGGGNTALEDALFLSNYCNKVYLIHRRDEFRGEEKLVERLRGKANVEFVLNCTVESLEGEDALTGVKVKNKISAEEKILEASGLFIAIGQIPDNMAFSSLVKLDKSGYVVAGEDCKTDIAGIYAAGDCRTKTVRQLVTAAGDGSVAALAAVEFIG